MSSGLNNLPSGNSLPLPPRRKNNASANQAIVSSGHVHPLLFPVASAGNGGLGAHVQPHNMLLSGGISTLAFAPVAFPNQTTGLLVHQAAACNGLLVPTASSSQYGPQDFFQGWKLRSGKWLEEEESYAELLIDMFDKGYLLDCVTGSTLRAYLAQKLHCAPMRISKKYAGKGIGKKVYSSRIDTRKNASTTFTEQRRKLQVKVAEAERKFHESAALDAVSTSPRHYCFDGASSFLSKCSQDSFFSLCSRRCKLLVG